MAFVLADGWLLTVGEGGLYRLAMDTYFDLAHQIYAGSGGGMIVFLIDVLVAGSSAGVLWWSCATGGCCSSRAPYDADS
jgi:hypothetical protein